MNSQNGATRATFLSEIRRALGRDHTHVPPIAPPAVDERIVRRSGAGDDLSGVFTARASEVGMVVHHTTMVQLAAELGLIMKSLAVRRAVCDLLRPPLDDAVAHAVREQGVDLRMCAAGSGFDGYFDADVGISGVQLAIAESGTLVCASADGCGHGVSLVPPVHVALLRASDLVPDMIDCWRHDVFRDGARLPSRMTMITGPSKTADIEGVLVTGVHGPREVHILLIADM